MAQRNLTVQFKTLRDGFNARRRPRRRNFETYDYDDLESQFRGEEAEGEVQRHGLNATLPPYWVDSVEEVKRITSSIKMLIGKLSQIHRQRLLVRFDNSESSQDKEIDVMTQQITQKFRLAEQKIRQNLANIGPKGAGQTVDDVMRENTKRQLAQELQQLSMNFRKMQKEYMMELKAQKTGGSHMDDILGLSGSGGNAQNSMLQLREEIALGSGMSEAQVMLLQVEEESVQERDKEIQHIVESINELSSIFKDLATLVIDQGTMLDRIDYNLENVQIRTEKGLSELIKADKYAENSRPFKCIMILVSIIVVECLMLIIQHS